MGPKGPYGLLSSLRMPISIFIPSFIDLMYIRDLKIPPFLRSSLAPRRMGASRRDERSEYMGAPKGHPYMPNTLKKGPISVLEESGRNFQSPKIFKMTYL